VGSVAGPVLTRVKITGHHKTLYHQHCDCSNLGHAKELLEEGEELATFGTEQPPVKRKYTEYINICHVLWPRRILVRSWKEISGSMPNTFSPHISLCSHLAILFTGVLVVMAV
jgi:hypothetical protein